MLRHVRPRLIIEHLMIAVCSLMVGLSLAGCTLFRPEMTESGTYQPVQSEFQLRTTPPADLGLIDTNAVYAQKLALARETSSRGVPHYRYLRFGSSGIVFQSGFHPDSVTIEQVLLTGEVGSYGLWTDIDHKSAAHAEMRIKMEFYADALYLFTLRHARVYEDSIVVYREEARRLFGFDNDEHIVYRKQTDVPPLPPLRWPD